MSVYHSAYDTTICQSLDMVDTYQAIAKSLTSNNLATGNNPGTGMMLQTKESDMLVYVITGARLDEDQIPFFNHPVSYCDGVALQDSHVFKSLGVSRLLAIDYRPFINSRASLSEGITAQVISSFADYDYYTKRSVLSMPWLTGDYKSLRHNFEFAGLLYGAWISESLGRIFMLDPRDQLIIFIIAHLFYQNLFFESEIITDTTKESFAVHTIKATRASADMVYEVMERCTELGTISHMCSNILNVTDNVRLRDLNAGFLITRLSSSWFGYGAAENVAVALEHPPTWIAMVISSLELKSYKNTMISKTAERHVRKANMKDVLDSYRQMKSIWLENPNDI